eukprot:m.91190 g.91190  ORF g.91190 m.91190 type:complete len:773 (-) comp13291_c0_seq2:63-2381(-)
MATLSVMFSAILAALVIGESFAVLPYQDTRKSVTERTQDLLSRMTVEEKVMQLLQPWSSLTPEEIIAEYKNTGLGAWYLPMINVADNSPKTLAIARNKIQVAMMNESRLQIPISFIQETLHSGCDGCTIFPMPINFASTWNTDLMHDAAEIIASDARSVGTDRGFSPVINMFPDPRYGRLQEGFSEDPTITKFFGAAHLTGLQKCTGGPTEYLTNMTHGLVATVKHYAAYGKGSYDGSQADISEQRLREIYLEPWRYLVDKGLRSVMAAQNMVNGRPMHSNKRLLTEILREEWGVTNALIESDGPDCIQALNTSGFHVANSTETAGIMGLVAGMDQDLGGTAFRTLLNSVQENKVDIKYLNRAAGNVLMAKFAGGQFDNPFVDISRAEKINPMDNKKLALRVAEESIVLLKNDDKTLPLNFGGIHQVALLGSLADDAASQCGGYTNMGAPVTTVRQAFNDTLIPQGVSVRYMAAVSPDNNNISQVDKAVSLIEASDVAVLVLGDSLTTCGEMYDRSSLDLPGGQMELLHRAIQTSTPVIVVLINGRAVTFGEGNVALNGIKGLLVAWRPGQEGGNAILNVLKGAVNPSGRLTTAWPRCAGAIYGPSTPYLYPFQGDHMGQNYTVDGSSSPLFGFGYGMSYSNDMEITKMEISPQQVQENEVFRITVTAVNNANQSVKMPVQIYFRDPVANPVRISNIQLLTFTKVDIAGGATVSVTLDVNSSSLGFWNDGKNGDGHSAGWMIDKGLFELYAGYAGFTSWDNVGGLPGNVTVV